MSYADQVVAARRLAILLALYFAAGYTMQRAVLRDQVERTGFVTSHDKFASEISWLAEMGLVDPLEIDAVMLSARGEDVALGRIQEPGVRRPSPGELKGGS